MPEINFNDPIIRFLITLIGERAERSVETGEPFVCFTGCGAEFAPGGTAQEKEQAAFDHYGLGIQVYHIHSSDPEEQERLIAETIERHTKEQELHAMHHEQARFRVN